MASMPESDDKLNGELYNALLKEEMENVIKLCERVPDRAMHVVTIHKDTVLHLATYSKQAELVLGLMQALPDPLTEKMTCKNDTGNTVLHEAATLDDDCSVQIAKKMLEKAPELLNICNELGESVLFQAARYGKTRIFDFLADKISEYDVAEQKQFSQRTDKTTMLHIAILARHFARRFGHIVGERDQDGMTALQLLSCNPSAFEPARRRGFLKRISNKVVPNSHESALDLSKLLVEKDTSWKFTSSKVDGSKPKAHNFICPPNVPSTYETGESQESSLGLSKLSVKEDTSWKFTSSNVDLSKSKQQEYGCHSYEMGGSSRQQLKQGGVTPLFLATMSGCVEIVKEILRIYPQAVEHIDVERQTILHVAIKCRQLEVFEHVSKMEVPMRWLVRRIDINGNTILHMVGMPRQDYVPEKMLGPALQLQEELLWFERVKSVIKGAFIYHRNNMKVTAEVLFANTKSDLRNAARDWLIRTAQGCSIVAVLMVTVAFAAAYTIPGGPNQNTGVPVLLNEPFFVVFTATDVLSLACALTSVVIFLSILTAPFRLEDFKHSLPNKLMLGFTFLFFSVVMMMISFSATIILMIRTKERWTKILLYSLSFLPVGIFALAYLPLYLSLSKTYMYLLKKIIGAFNCRYWFPAAMSKNTSLYYSDRKLEIRSSSICLQGGTNNSFSRDNAEGGDFCSQNTSQATQCSV
ncbi:uncharacterized protein LOC115989250 isoform X3 [Quercus lobata]|uniref:uncharacterized protein LOC115989250 isoform X3 n=1 Tax=Quercus lobata TaxID=97700 RepID=UPI001247C0BF|nr:uncharacterized protein LOC115989250 isoform X3 [Quercus lobata]